MTASLFRFEANGTKYVMFFKETKKEKPVIPPELETLWKECEEVVYMLIWLDCLLIWVRGVRRRRVVFERSKGRLRCGGVESH